MKNGIIYSAYCISEEKYYIGQTIKDLNIRKREHLWHAKSGSKTYFHRALLKHNFIFYILEELKSENIFDLLNEREQYWISKLNSNNERFGYNLNKGGRNSKISNNNIFKHKPETIEKIKQSLIGEKNPMFGKSIYDRWVEVYGKEEADLKMIEYVKKHKLLHSLEKNGMFGKFHNSETIRKMKEKAKYRIGKKASRYIKVDEEKLLKLMNLGFKIKDIAIELNVSQFVVRKRIKEVSKI